ncbi:MAG: hypothetical protein H6Q38_1961 [Chloroflexi bacterium]|nr:hypothetical protein [Chloroflexota bacterium]
MVIKAGRYLAQPMMAEQVPPCKSSEISSDPD